MDEAVTFEVADPASDEARAAMSAYFDELDERFPGGFDPGDALTEGASRYRPPTGCFVLGLAGGEVAACGAVDLLDADTAEIKRMWVAPSERGAGVGRRLLARLEDEARRAGRSRVVLDTNGVLAEAIALYRSRGYAAIERYNDNPYAQRWFAKALPAE